MMPGENNFTTNRDLLRVLWRIRLVEERIVALHAEQQIRCPLHLSIGQEAVAAGVCSVLNKTDVVMSGHRAHAHYLAKGGSLHRLMAELYGKESGCSRGRGGSMHLIDLAVNFIGSTPIVGGTIPVAVGAAWAAKITKKNNLTVLFTGEGATEEGVWHESLNFAALHKLPIIFICENNLYSVYTPLAERQPPRSLTKLAAAHGLMAARGDGNDVQVVRRLTLRAKKHVLAGKGPYFIELTTYRWREHCGPNYDNNIGYRTEAEFLHWQKKDPLRRLKKWFLQQPRGGKKALLKMEMEIIEEIDTAVSQAQKAAPSQEKPEANLCYAPNL